MDVIKKILNETKLDPTYLEIEITENILIKNTETILTILKELREIGIKIALDDFGTGYCSLSYLKTIPMDVVKIDRSFIKNIPIEPVDTSIVTSVINLAKILGKRVVAEGVETMEQMQFLYEKNCDEIQGYLYSKPITMDAFQNYLLNKKVKLGESVIPEENRRKYIRLELEEGMNASFIMSEFLDKENVLEDVSITIQDLGMGGISFTSPKELKINQEQLYRVKVILKDQLEDWLGQLVWTKYKNDDLFEYGLRFFLSEEQRITLKRIIKNL